MFLSHCRLCKVNQWYQSSRIFQNASKTYVLLRTFISRFTHVCPPKPFLNRNYHLCPKGLQINLNQAVNDLEQSQIVPNISIYSSLLCLSAQANDLSCGKRIVLHLLKSRWSESSYLQSYVLQMYTKCGAQEEAHALFERMLKPNAYSWGHLIAVYASFEDGHQSWHIFDRMQWEGVRLQKGTFVNLLSSPADASALNRGKQLHVLIRESGLHTCLKVGTALMMMYMRCGSLGAARSVFDCLVERDVVAWNALIAGYNEQGQFGDAFQVFSMLEQEAVTPTKSTYTSAIDACTGQRGLTEGRKVYGCVTSAGLDSDVIIVTALINMYGKCNSLDDAQSMFCQSKERDIITWNTMIAVYSRFKLHHSVLQTFVQMQNEGWAGNSATFVNVFNSFTDQSSLSRGKKMHVYAIWLNVESDVEVSSSILHMYGKCAQVNEAEKVFSRLKRRDLPSWTSMIAAYIQNKNGRQALQLFHQMRQEGMNLDKVAFLGILPAYGSEAVVNEAHLVHTDLCYMGLDCDVDISNALITVYGKCGSLRCAHKIFDVMLERDLISWNALLTAYAQHGLGNKALMLYDQLQMAGIEPDYVTYISVSLACSHSGLLEEGQRYLVSMTQEYKIFPNTEHYNCLIDLLARAGQLDRAEIFLQSLESKPTYSHWVTFLGGCRNGLDIERGEHAAIEALKLDPSNMSPYILLANISNLVGCDHF
ncbi:hypothetical protein KP509_27G067100 [Ceratopteris richardii]|uniref:Pentatricopeptide repeat-containing protein n=1 Tax=Ceratopteris richardii TaxID=49495 RepID=A0A8T2RHE5_CERRI|nr:hypothetical protein KP509_27G067100 [Ceratopteris richardii]